MAFEFRADQLHRVCMYAPVVRVALMLPPFNASLPAAGDQALHESGIRSNEAVGNHAACPNRVPPGPSARAESGRPPTQAGRDGVVRCPTRRDPRAPGREPGAHVPSVAIACERRWDRGTDFY